MYKGVGNLSWIARSKKVGTNRIDKTQVHRYTGTTATAGKFVYIFS